jgi:hypothetical protein
MIELEVLNLNAAPASLTRHGAASAAAPLPECETVRLRTGPASLSRSLRDRDQGRGRTHNLSSNYNWRVHATATENFETMLWEVTSLSESVPAPLRGHAD